MTNDIQYWSEDAVTTLKMRLLVDAIQSAFGLSTGGARRKPSKGVWSWITSDDQHLPLSFNQCCYANDLDPELMRSLLNYYRKKHLH